MNALFKWYDSITERLRAGGDWLAPLGIRLLLAHEFWKAGALKFRDPGGNVSGFHARQDFPFPFGSFPDALNFFLVTWFELAAAVALILGLFTRFFAFTLVVITAVAIASVHWPSSWDSLGQLWEGYSVSRVMDDGEFRGNFRIPALFLAMLMPLLFMGGGKLSLDHLLVKLTGRSDAIDDRNGDYLALSLVLLVPGLVFVYLIPLWGVILLLGAIGAAVYHKMSAA